MLGAIAGDVIGSVYEYHNIKTIDFPLFHKHCRFTDDTVMTVAIAYSLLTNTDYATSMKLFGRKYPSAGYGSSFVRWLSEEDVRPYNSWGNGSAMRVSPLGFAIDEIDVLLAEARCSAEVSHNHPEGVKGAQATALAILLARKSKTKECIRAEISERFDYDLNRSLDEIRQVYQYNESCQGTVPEAIIAFLESSSYEGAVRNAISLGGDSDTLACIAGGIAQAYYKTMPHEIIIKVLALLPEDLLNVVEMFNREYHL
jgi:ADP-ribosylglycohydrolase